MGFFKSCHASGWKKRCAWLPTKLAVSGTWVWLVCVYEIRLVDSQTQKTIERWICKSAHRPLVMRLLELRAVGHSFQKLNAGIFKARGGPK